MLRAATDGMPSTTLCPSGSGEMPAYFVYHSPEALGMNNLEINTGLFITSNGQSVDSIDQKTLEYVLPSHFGFEIFQRRDIASLPRWAWICSRL